MSNKPGWKGSPDNSKIALLQRGDLAGYVYSKIDWSGQDLSGVDLQLSDLSETNLSKANLSKANLSGSNLNGANLKGTDLSEATLDNATLIDISYDDTTQWPESLAASWLQKAKERKQELLQRQLEEQKRLEEEKRQLERQKAISALSILSPTADPSQFTETAINAMIAKLNAEAITLPPVQPVVSQQLPNYQSSIAQSLQNRPAPAVNSTTKPKYHFLCVPFIGHTSLNDQYPGRALSNQLQEMLVAHAQQGWEFYSVDTVRIRMAPGCLGTLFGQKAIMVEYDIVIFRHEIA